VALGVPLVDFQGPDPRGIVDGCVLESIDFLTRGTNEIEEFNVDQTGV
jgi:hypothetical protein